MEQYQATGSIGADEAHPVGPVKRDRIALVPAVELNGKHCAAGLYGHKAAARKPRQAVQELAGAV